MCVCARIGRAPAAAVAARVIPFIFYTKLVSLAHVFLSRLSAHTKFKLVRYYIGSSVVVLLIGERMDGSSFASIIIIYLSTLLI